MMQRKCSNCVWSQVFCDDNPCRSCRNKSRWEFKLPSKSRIHYSSMSDDRTEKLWTKNNPYITNTICCAILTPTINIKNVIFNDPATIVFWSDGTKTVVKVQDGDEYDEEKGLAMAISKKALGNKGNYCNEFKKWLPEEDETGSINIEYNGVNLLDLLNTSFGIKKEK